MTLIELTNTPDDQRDTKWENQFFKALTEGFVELISDAPVNGPDGWPYIMVRTEGNNGTATATLAKPEPTQKILHWLSTRGIGLVVNPEKPYPDFVFSYGMVWHFMKTGLFYRSDARPNTSVELSPNQAIHSGPPTEEYLPSGPRSILKEFLRDQGLLAPKILLISTDRLNYDLAFSLESLKNPPATEHEGIAEAISWFLPPHYSILLVSEKGLPPFLQL